jgi:hypothetical protein
LGYRRSSQQSRQHGARSIIERHFAVLVSYFDGTKELARAGRDLPEFMFANDAPSYCTAATSSPPVRLRPDKLK